MTDEVSWKDLLEEELGSRSEWVLVLEGGDGEPTEGARAVSVLVTEIESGHAMAVEIGVDASGSPFVVVRSFDDAGQPKPSTVFDVDGSVFVHLGP